MDALIILLCILFSVLVPVLAFALLLYAVPVRAAVRLLIRDGKHDQILTISWGVLGIRISGFRAGLVNEVLIADHAILSHTGTMETGTEMEGKGTPVESPAQSSTASSGSIAAGSRQISEIVTIIERVAGPVGSFVSAFRRQSRFEDTRGRVILGMGNPVLTGEICGMYWASRFLFQASRIYIDLEPVFDRDVLELDITIRMKVAHPLLVLVAGCRLVWPGLETTRVVLQKRKGDTSA